MCVSWAHLQNWCITSVPTVRLYLDSLGPLPIITGTKYFSHHSQIPWPSRQMSSTVSLLFLSTATQSGRWNLWRIAFDRNKCYMRTCRCRRGSTFPTLTAGQCEWKTRCTGWEWVMCCNRGIVLVLICFSLHKMCVCVCVEPGRFNGRSYRG